VTDLERGRYYSPQRQPPPGVAVDRHKDRGLALTPAEVAARRSNRRWMLILVGVSAVILGLGLVSMDVASSNEPTGPHITAPAGFKVENDSYFAYLVPTSWSNNPAGTDETGDVETSGPSGWVGEHIAYFRTTPQMGERPPLSLEAFQEPRPEPFRLSGGEALAVKGASGAFEYQATRPGGFHAVVVDAWSDATGVELWLMVDAPPAVTSRLLGSLTAGR
jgi:hypothetical protein